MEVTLEEAKAYLRVTTSDEDELIKSLISAATKQVQDITRQSDEEFMANEEKNLIRIRVAILYMVFFDDENVVHRIVTGEEHGFHEGSSLRKRNGIYY